MTFNSVALIGAKVATMGLGFVFWIVAARLFAPAEVGLAAAVVSAMMLCTQLALVGLGSAVIALYPRHQARPEALLNSAFTIATLVSVISGVLFLLLAAGLFSELDIVGAEPGYALLFVLAGVLGTLGILFDQVSTALRRGDQVVTRGLLFGGSALAALTLLAFVTEASGSRAIFVPWVVAGFAAVALGLGQLRRSLGGFRIRPTLRREPARELLRTGIPNWALTVSERAPGLVLPVVVIELLSPAANAAWYPLWMMAWALYIVPIQVGMTLFAELAHDPGSLRISMRRGIRSSLLLGGTGAVVLAVGGEIPLSLLGDGYAAAGIGPLRILVIAVVPLTFLHVYFATCRATGHLGEATATGWGSGVAAVAAAALLAPAFGLMGMATAWLVVQLAAGAWAAARLRRLDRRGRVRRDGLRKETAGVLGAAASAARSGPS
jgi:O-antigen/teichoic acid export membrane protein